MESWRRVSWGGYFEYLAENSEGNDAESGEQCPGEHLGQLADHRGIGVGSNSQGLAHGGNAMGKVLANKKHPDHLEYADQRI